MSGTTTQTVGGLINLALLTIGAVAENQTPSAATTNLALAFANQMLSAWNGERWNVYGLQDVSVVSTGAEIYTIGVGQSINTPRPDRIEKAYMVMSQETGPFPVSFDLELLSSYEDYSRIKLKTLDSFARAVFYDAGYPTGNVYFWPIPQADTFTMHLIVKQALPQFTDLTEIIALPPTYQEALMYNLAVRLRPAFGMAPDPTISGLATASLAALQSSNAQVPRLELPRELRSWGAGRYNVFSDSLN